MLQIYRDSRPQGLPYFLSRDFDAALQSPYDLQANKEASKPLYNLLHHRQGCP